MDCDGTHDPRYFKELFEKSKFYDYVITSRFKKNGLIKDWPIVRKIITILTTFVNQNFSWYEFRCVRRL
jgi:hypothetical protein